MCNIVLNDDLSIRSYFEKVLELVKSGEDFPVNLDEVWPLIYSDKGKAVRVLTGDNGFIKDIDYKVFTKNGKNPTGGRPTIVYMISVSCMEYLIARKERRVFDVYRSVFHGTANALNKTEASVEKNLPHNYIEALEALLASEKEKQALAEAKKAAEEAKMISDNIIKEQAPKVGFAETAIMANDKGDDMLIRDVRRELESHGCDIAERSLREFLQEQGFFYKNKREWILTENVMKNGYAHYRYNTDTGIRNTVYMTRKGFEKTLYNIKNKPQSRESFISFGGKIFD